MRMHEFGPQDAPAVLLIHGVLQPWQTLQAHAEALTDRYRVLVPALNGHVEEEATAFHSLEEEAAQLADWLLAHGIGHLHAACGFSMGGAVANVLWTDRRVTIGRLVLDGAPLVRTPKFVSAIMAASYRQIVAGSKARNPQTLANFEKCFLPGEFLPPFLAFVDHLDDASVGSIVVSVGTSHLHDDMPSGTRVMYLHGTAFPGEFLSMRTAKKLRKARPDAQIVKLPGYGHIQLAIYETEKWLQTVRPFLDA